jgi:hypothetical protein
VTFRPGGTDGRRPDVRVGAGRRGQCIAAATTTTAIIRTKAAVITRVRVLGSTL